MIRTRTQGHLPRTHPGDDPFSPSPHSLDCFQFGLAIYDQYKLGEHFTTLMICLYHNRAAFLRDTTLLTLSPDRHLIKPPTDHGPSFGTQSRFPFSLDLFCCLLPEAISRTPTYYTHDSLGNSRVS